MSKYTAQAHEERRNAIQELRSILMVSTDMINSTLPVAKTIGRLSAQMPTNKKHFISINADVDYLLQDKVTDLVSEELRTQWISNCKNLKEAK